MAQRVEEVWKVAKVGSKRTSSQPVFVLKFREVKKDPKRRLCPIQRSNGQSMRLERSWCHQESLAIGKSSNSGEKVKRPV